MGLDGPSHAGAGHAASHQSASASTPGLSGRATPGQRTPHAHATRTREQAEALGLLERHIFFYHDWVPYTLRANFLLEADIAVSLHRNHLETRYAAVRSRILDHLWAGLPSIITEGDTAAGMLEAAGAALVVPMDDSHALAQAINRLLSNRLQADQLSQAARKLATSLTWRHVAGPLVRFCQQPYRTRVAASPPDPSPPPPGPQGIQGDDPSPPPAPESLLAACRNAAVQVQEQTWQLHPPDPATGRLGRPRQVLIDQTVRPFVMPLVEQQQHHNIAVLRSIYAINEIADHRRTSTGLSIGKVNQRLDETNQRIVPIEKRADQLEQHIRRIEHNHRVLCQQLAEVAEQLAGLEDADTQLLQTLLARSPHPGPRST
ncbi:MAG: glycosyltransferase family 4 protein [Chloroflexaceae bacterium]|nr:glycosyltransferase family 4 protein [Chloroflexaceae bacterium]